MSEKTTAAQAQSFLESQAICLLFPIRGLPIPSLWEAVKGHQITFDWDDDAVRIWGWKDAFPLDGIAWYGKLLKAKGTFVARSALPLLLAAAGRRVGPREYDRLYRNGILSQDARNVAAWIEEHGPTPTSVLRSQLGGQGKPKVERAMTDLQRLLLLTHFGTDDRASGWPSAVLELTARAFSETLVAAAELDPMAARTSVRDMLRQHAPAITDREAERMMAWRT